MAVFKATDLLHQLEEDARLLKDQALQRLGELSKQKLTWKLQPNKWNIAECLEHLNRYSRYYLPALRKGIRNGVRPSRHPVFKSGWLGEVFVRSMLPTAGKIVRNKMKSPAAYNPLNAPLQPQQVVQDFIAYQTQWEELIRQMHEVDITSTKIPISISKWVRVRMGDVVRFNIAHTQRHMVQIENVLNHPDFPTHD
jgi:hypothetical protein